MRLLKFLDLYLLTSYIQVKKKLLLKRMSCMLQWLLEKPIYAKKPGHTKLSFWLEVMSLAGQG